MMYPLPRNVAAAVIAALSLIASRPADAGVVYHNDFGSSVAAFNETSDADWTADTGNGYYTFYKEQSVFAQYLAALVEVPQLGGSYTRDFVVKTRVNVVSPNFYGGVGLITLADAATLSGSVHHYRSYYWFTSNQMTIGHSELGDSPASSSGTLSSGTGMTGWTDLTITGTYQPSGSLRLEFTIVRGALSYARVFTDPTPATGQYFGLYGFREAWTGARYIEADFDYFTIESSSIPTPAAVGVVPLLLAVAGRRPERNRR